MNNDFNSSEEDYEELEEGLIISDPEGKELINSVIDIENNLKFVAMSSQCITSDIKEIINSYNQTSIMIKQIDAQLDAYLAKLEVDLVKFNAQLPVIERLLNRISDRIDNSANEIINRNRGNLTREELQQQSLLLDMFQRDSETFNEMIMKLLLR